MNPNLTQMLKDQLGLPDEFIGDDVLEWLEQSLTDGAKIKVIGSNRTLQVQDDRS